MKQNAEIFAALTALLLVGGTLGVGCGGRIAAWESVDSGGRGGSAATGGSGGDTGTGGSTGGAGGAGGSTGGTGGSGGSTGGTGGGAGKGGAAGSGGGTIPPGSITCGTSICAPVTGGPLGTLSPCCPPAMANDCGAIVAVAGNACFTSNPGVPDSRCPNVQVMGIPLTGCCRPNGLCGASLQMIGLGCNDPVFLGGMPAGRCGGAP